MKKLKKQMVKKVTALLLVASMGVLVFGGTVASENSVQLYTITQDSQESY